MTTNAVAVTGVGVVCPNGGTREAFWDALLEGRSGIGDVELFDTTWLRCKIAGEVKGFDASSSLEGLGSCDNSRPAQFAIAATREALAHSGVKLDTLDRRRVGVVFGTCQGALHEIESLGRVRLDFMHSSCDAVARALRLLGPRVVVANACAAGTNAIGLGREKLLCGESDLVVAGGTDALTFFAMAGFTILQSIDLQPCSPYGRSSGLTVGEGAAVLVLERLESARDRGARVLAELAGCGLSADAYHITAPDPSGRGAVLAMLRALGQAGLSQADVSYVNGHGTGTYSNDAMEKKALRTLFGERSREVPVSSTKSMIGHSFGASGAIEAAACVLAIERGAVPPTTNLPKGNQEPEFDFVPDRARPAVVDVAMSNNYAFGGSNASLVFTAPRHGQNASKTTRADVVVTGIGAHGALGTGVEAWWEAFIAGRSGIGQIKGFDAHRYRCRHAAESQPLPARGFAAPGMWRRMDGFTRECLVSARLAWSHAGLEPTSQELERTALLFATGTGSFDTMNAFYDSISPNGANPSFFPNSVMNAPAGHVCSALGIRGPTSTITSGGVSAFAALGYATHLIDSGETPTVLVMCGDRFCEALLARFHEHSEFSSDGVLRPFDRTASGTVLGEATVTIVLEAREHAKARGAKVLARLRAVAMAGDDPLDERSGDGLRHAISLALERSGLDAGEVGYCAAAASGIRERDESEARALAAVFGRELLVGAPKSMTGETLGSGGAINVVAAVLALSEGQLTPSVNLEAPFELPLSHVTGRAIEQPVDVCIANGAAFGGNYASAVLAKAD